MFTPRVGDSKLLLAVTEFSTVMMQHVNSENHTSKKSIPIFFQQVSLINQCWVRLRSYAREKNAIRILASSTKMRNNFSIFVDELYLLGV